eukprot:9704930-Alexandrium_andersonii.AAC.1
MPLAALAIGRKPSGSSAGSSRAPFDASSRGLLFEQTAVEAWWNQRWCDLLQGTAVVQFALPA